MPINPTLPDWRAESLWDDLWSWLGQEFPDNRVSLPLVEWPPLYCQAILAHDAGAREVSAMACRAVVESVTYVFRTYRHDSNFGWVRNYPVTPKGTPDRWDFSDVKPALRDSGVLTPELEIAVDHIKFDGDAAAHISQRMDDEVEAHMGKSKRRSGAPTNPDQLWMTEEDVRRDLEQTLVIIKTILLAAKRERDRSSVPRPS